jgi:hypothetical protein
MARLAAISAGGDMALVDPGTFADPCVVGIHDLFQIVVGQHLLGQITAGSCDTRIDHDACLFS